MEDNEKPDKEEMDVESKEPESEMPADGKERHCAYKLVSALGENEAGSIVVLPDEAGDALVKAGLAVLASAEDIEAFTNPSEDNMEQEPVLQNSIEKLTKTVEDVASAAINKAMKKTDDTPVYAEVKKPIYKSNGHYLRDALKAMFCGDQAARNRARGFELEYVAPALEEQGHVINKAILGINETTSSSGGYLVNPMFSTDVYVPPHGQMDLLSKIPSIESKGNVYNQRLINTSSVANGSIFGGLNVVATSEGTSFTSSLPVWGNLALQLVKFGVFQYLTIEVLEDASYPLEAELNDYVDKAFRYNLNNQIVQGSSLTGLLNENSLITVTKSSNSTSYTSNPATCLTWADCANIWSRVYPDCQESSAGCFIANPGLQASLNQMTYVFTGNAPAWGIQFDGQDGLVGRGDKTPYRLFGKPLYMSFAASAPGNAGDIFYVDFNTFKHLKKPFRMDRSNDIQFPTDQVAVKWVARLDVRSVFRNAITGNNGSLSYSNIVTRSASGT